MKIRQLKAAVLILVLLLTGAAGGTKTVEAAPSSANEAKIFQYLTEEMDFNTAAACGVLANIVRESGFNPNSVGDNGTSYGICQWHASRYTRLMDWCAENGYDYTTLDGQLHYLHYELPTYYKSTWNYLQGVDNTADGAYDAAWYWCYYFERPANKANTSVARGNLAKDTYWPAWSGSGGEIAPIVTELLITSQPSDQTVEADKLHKFIVEVNMESGSTYQWQVKESASSDWRDFTEKKTAKTKQLYFTVTKAMHLWQFRCIVKNGTETAVSDPFTVSIEGMSAEPTATPAPNGLTVTSQPSDQTVEADKLHKFIVEVNKPDGASYQWQVKEDASSDWRDFTEKKTAKTKQLWFTVTENMHGWQFRCTVKNGGDEVISTPFTVWIEGLPVPQEEPETPDEPETPEVPAEPDEPETPEEPESRLVITSQPSDMTVEGGKLYKFIVELNETDGASYQWQVKEDASSDWRDFKEKQTAKTYRLWFTVTDAMDGWQFRCVAKQGGDTVVSEPFTVTVE